MTILISDKKYTVILSAYQADNTPLENLIATELMRHQLENEVHVHAIRGIGVYHGASEQTFVIHTNSHNQAYEVRTLGLHQHNQECVLMSNNRKHVIKLHNTDGYNTVIGERFMQTNKPPQGYNSYTILNGTDYYYVV